MQIFIIANNKPIDCLYTFVDCREDLTNLCIIRIYIERICNVGGILLIREIPPIWLVADWDAIECFQL